ncbi:MAG: KH domain-containing protein, partial [Pirellulaceae bacterium]
MQISDPETVLRMFGPQDQNLRQIKQEFGVSITHRAGLIKISGSPEAVRSATEQLERYRNPAAATTLVTSVPLPLEPNNKPMGAFAGADKKELAIHHPTLRIVPRTEGQARYVETIR